jgi:hypothetical protein
MTSDLGAPKVFLDFCLYAATAVALERRVFYGQLDGRPWFINNYMLLVGPAGVGKGQSLREVKRVLSMFPMMDGGEPVLDNKTGEPVPLFYSLSDTMTFEHIVLCLATEKRAHVKPDQSVYQHTSAYVILEELSSLLRVNKSDDVARLLLNLYDCEQYEYKTKRSGSYTIKNGCFNLLAGTTVDFLAQAEKNGLAGEGLMSRFMLVYADTRQFDRFFQSEMSAAQKEAQREVATHLFKLSQLFGQLTIGDHALEYLEEWWKSEQAHLASFGDPKLDNFFTRRKAHVMKLAAAIHFTEEFSLEISIEAFQKATMMVRELEEPVIKMLRHAGGKNLAYSIGERLLSRLARQGRMTHGQVVDFLHTDLDFQQAQNLLQTLQQSGKMTKDGLLWKLSNPPSKLASLMTTSSLPDSSGLPNPSLPMPILPPPVTGPGTTM